MTVGDRIKALRIKNGYTQKELAEKCGYKSLTTINKIELNINSVPIATVEKIAEVFGVSPAYLMGWDEHDINPVRPMTDTDREIIRLVSSMSEENKRTFLAFIKTVVADKDNKN